MGYQAITRRYRVPVKGEPPLIVAYASNTEPVRVLLRNEGSGANEEDVVGVIPAPLNPFNWFSIGYLGLAASPTTLPMGEDKPALLATEYNDLIYTPNSCYMLGDGGQDVIILAPSQSLYAVSYSTVPIMITVEVVTGLLDEDVYLLDY